MATAYLRRAVKRKSGSIVNMQGSEKGVDVVLPIGVLASPLRPRHVFTGRRARAANLLAASLSKHDAL